jgi:hypothetical protein
VGGVTLVVCKRVFTGWTVSKLYYPDPSGCVMYLAADLHHSDGRRAHVLGTYLPQLSSDPLTRLSPVPSFPCKNQASFITRLCLLCFAFLCLSCRPEAPPPVFALATKVRLFLSSFPPLPERPAMTEVWFWYRYEGTILRPRLGAHSCRVVQPFLVC